MQRNLFTEIDLATVRSSMQQPHQLLSSINEMIRYINTYANVRKGLIDQQIRMLSTEISAARVANEPVPTAKIKQFIQFSLLAVDVEQRTNFVCMLTNDMQKERLKKLLHQNWLNKLANGEQISDDAIKNKLVELDNLFVSFSDYSRFAHVTADELVVIAIMIDFMIKIINNEKKSVTADEAVLLEKKCEEFYAARNEIKKCMEAHLAVDALTGNPTESSAQSLSASILAMSGVGSMIGSACYVESVDPRQAKNNDILLNLKRQVNTLFRSQDHDHDVIKLEQHHFVDHSLHLAIPELPVDVRYSESVLGYFNNYLIDSPLKPRASSSVGSWFTTLKNLTSWATSWCSSVYTLVASAVSVPPQFIELGYSALNAKLFKPRDYLVQCETNITHAVARPLVHAPQSESSSSSQPERIPQSIPVSSEESVSQQKLIFWKNKIKLLQEQISAEEQRMRTSCFSFLWRDQIILKNAKIMALNYLSGSDSLLELQTRALEYKSPEQSAVLAGAASRTRELIESILTIDSPQQVQHIIKRKSAYLYIKRML